MNAQSHPAPDGDRRRPAPPRQAAPPQRPAAVPVTYVPDSYDPRLTPAVASVSLGEYGLVFPSQRTGRGVWAALALIVATLIAFVGWRAQQSGASDSRSGVTYTSPGGGFVAHFPAQPTETANVVRHGALQIAFHTVAVDGQAVVAEADARGRLPGDAHRLRGYVLQHITSTGLDLTSVRSVTFHGAQARQGNLVRPTGEVFAVLVVAESARRYFVLAAPLGGGFDALKSSFRMLH